MGNNGNQWRKRLTTSFTCPSGEVIQIRRPSPSLLLRGMKAIRIFERGGKDVFTNIEKNLAFIESLPDAELDAIYTLARIMLTDVVADPKLYLNPTADQLSPDDLPPLDFWAIFSSASTGIHQMPVQLKEGETTVEAVQTFPGRQGSGDRPVEDGTVM